METVCYTRLEVAHEFAGYETGSVGEKNWKRKVKGLFNFI